MKTELRPGAILHPPFLPDVASTQHEKLTPFQQLAYRFVRKLLEPQNSPEQHQTPNSFTTLLIQLLVRFVFFLEPLIPFFAAYFLNKQLNSWKKMNLILNHKVRITRVDRFCYRIDLHLVVTTRQVGNIIIEGAKNMLTRLASKNQRS